MMAISLNEGGVYVLQHAFALINYETVLGNEAIWYAYLILIARSIIRTIAGLFATLLVAFDLSYRRLAFPRDDLSNILITILFNGGIGPFYIQLNDLGLLNMFCVYIQPACSRSGICLSY